MQNFKPLLIIVTIALFGFLNAQTYPTTQWRDLADTSWYNATDDSFDLTTAEQLAGLSLLVDEGNSFAGKTINIEANIDLDGHIWTPIGKSFAIPFSGNVEGNDHVISNLWITGLNRAFIGFFGQSVNASYKNLNLDTAHIDDVGTDSGSLVANLVTSTMDNCHAYNIEMKVLGSNIGGLVGGVLTDSWVNNCSFSGNITGINQVGGITGSLWDHSKITESYSEGNVNAEFIVGGMFGMSTLTFAQNRESTVENCYSRSNVTATDSYGAAGGAVGYAQVNLIIKNSYSTGTVTAIDAAGGFFGKTGNIISENNYFDTESSGMTNGIGVIEGADVEITAKTTAEMKTQAMVDLLNAGIHDGPWLIDASANDGYPFLGEIHLSVTDMTNSVITVYPTVTSNHVNVVTENANSSYKVFNSAGSMVKAGKLNQLNSKIEISELSSGVYIIQIQSGNTAITKKIIKK